MEPLLNTTNTKRNSIIALVVFLILAIGFVLSGKYRNPVQEDSPTFGSTNDKPAIVVVENTPMVNGTLSVPTGFPPDIPLEKGKILESAATHYPDQNAQQLSISYRSSKTIAQKYTEYKDYMNQTGYTVTEGGSGSSMKAVFGTKEKANLSVVVSSSEGATLVQLSYLLKSAGE